MSCPSVMNPCGRHNGGCQQICVLSHRSDNDGLGFRCKCRHGYDLHADRHTCFSEFLLIEGKITWLELACYSFYNILCILLSDVHVFN